MKYCKKKRNFYPFLVTCKYPWAVLPEKLGRDVRPRRRQSVEEGGRYEEVASSKKNRIKDWGAKIDTLFMTKTAEKPYPLGPHIAI